MKENDEAGAPAAADSKDSSDAEPTISDLFRLIEDLRWKMMYVVRKKYSDRSKIYNPLNGTKKRSFEKKIVYDVILPIFSI